MELTRPAIIELQCFELMFKGMVELLSSGELKSIGDNVRDAAGPWTVKTKSSAGSQAGEEVDIEVEISLPSLDGAGEGGISVKKTREWSMQIVCTATRLTFWTKSRSRRVGPRAY